MLFSGKITHSVLAYLAQNGIDSERLIDLSDLPTEFLRDPACWLEAGKVEEFLEAAEQACVNLLSEAEGYQPSLLQTIGHKAPELNAWGGLDSVLRIVHHPRDIFGQPERFISYFVSPAPPIGNLQKQEESLTFELPISSAEYPRVTEYLTAAIESIPAFMGREAATAHWRENLVAVNWSRNQSDLLSGDKDTRHMNPEFIQSLIVSLETAERELQNKNQRLAEQSQKMAELETEVENLRSSTSVTSLQRSSLSQPFATKKVKKSLDHVQAQIMRLNDYLARSQQLVTLIVGKEKGNSHIQEAMRRMDWDYIRGEYPNLVNQGLSSVKDIQNALTEADRTTDEIDAVEEGAVQKARVKIDLGDLVNMAIERSLKTNDQPVQLDKVYFFEDDVEVVPSDMESALSGLVSSSLQSMSKGRDQMRIVTRPCGRRVEIEITDTGELRDEKQVRGTSFWKQAQRIVKQHNGQLAMSSSKAGSTFVVNLPM